MKDAIDFFEGCRETGPGNVFSALRFALADPRVDTIVLLTDGAPSGGRRWNLKLMVDLIREENRYRRVAIDVVLVDATATLSRHWGRVAADSGGRLVEVSLQEWAR